MPRHAKNIYINFEGGGAKIKYWAGGHGSRVSGYLTSLPQVHSALCRYFSVRGLRLFTVLNRKALCISSESVLKQVIGAVPSGGFLLVHAYRRRETIKFYDYSEYSAAYRTYYYPKLTHRNTRQMRPVFESNEHHRLRRFYPS